MRNQTREQLLIRVITLLDNASLGDRKETISNLLHGARRASREQDDFTAQEHRTEALSQLRKARHSLRVSGAAEQEITPLEYAIELLLPVKEDAAAESLWRYLLLFLLLPAGVTLVLTPLLWLAGQLPGL